MEHGCQTKVLKREDEERASSVKNFKLLGLQSGAFFPDGAALFSPREE